MNSSQIKEELTVACRRGIAEYLDTMRGANLRAEVSEPKKNVLMISLKDGGLRFFEVIVKETH